MSTEELNSHREYLDLAIQAQREGRQDKAKQYLSNILDHVDESWTAEEVRTRARLIEGQISYQKNLGKSRLIVSIVFLANAFVLGALAFIPVNSVYVEGEISTQRVKIKTNEYLSIEGLAAESIDVSGFGKLILDDQNIERQLVENNSGKTSSSNTAVSASPFSSQLTVQSISDYSSAYLENSFLSLQYLDVHSNSTIVFQRDDELPNLIRVELVQGRVEGEVLPAGKTKMSLDRVKIPSHENWQGEIYLSPGNPVIFDSQARPLHLEISTGENAASGPVMRNHLVSEIGFTERIAGNEASMLVDGSIILSSFDENVINLRQGDFLVVEMSNPIAMQRMSLENPIEVRFEGEVSSLIRNGRNLKPSWLEWLFKHNLSVLYFMALSSVASFFWANMKRLDLLRTP